MQAFIYIVLVLTACLLFLSGSWAAIVSLREKEKRAFSRFTILAFILPLPFLLLAFFKSDFQLASGIILLVITYGSLLFLLFPTNKNKSYKSPVPLEQIDERDSMFSRNELVPGTVDYDNYYKRKPECPVLK